jgi:eukaryotic-like serine/threonine-protein kinase
MPETTQFAGMDSGESQHQGSLQANTVLLHRYKILGVIGGGGMGTVYQARDLNFPDVRKLVAVKEMLNPTTDPALRSQTLKTFRREANILATLAHPAIPKIFEFFDQEERAYLVMEYINGSDLELLLTKTKELPIEKIVEWAIDLCDVLHYLHSQPEPIIFRDMKPSNVMIDSLGKVRLIDFGIAKTFIPNVKNTMIGTEGYSAPEQYKGNVSPLSDIYSLGATLHHVLTRRDPRLEPPFSFNERPIPDFNPKAPSGLVNIVEKSVAFDPAERFQTCAEMKEALEQTRYRSSPIAINDNHAQAGAGAAAQGGTATSFFDDMAQFGAIEPKWRFSTEDEIRCSPVAFKDMAFVGSYDTNVWAVKLNATDPKGEFVWKFPTNAGIASSPVIDESNRLVLFGSEDYTFYALDYRNGRISWSYNTQDRIRGTACVAHDHVFFGSDDGYLYALVAGNGRFLWKYDVSAPVRGRPFVTNELVIVGAESGDVIGLELSGTRKWGFRAKRNVTSSPFVDTIEGVCYVGASDGFVYALDANSGYSSWRFRTHGPVISSPVLQEDLLYFGSADGHVYAINARTSKEKWKFATEKPIVGSAAVHQDAVYIGSTDEYLYCLDAKSGKERWKFKTNGPITSTPYVGDGVLLVGSMDKTLYALPLVN